MTTDKEAAQGRTARKHVQILDAATGLFLDRGYAGTSMDEVAAEAQVSKQTVYKHFKDKESLFAEIVLRTAERSDAFIATVLPMLESAQDLRATLEELACTYIATVMQPRGIQLRRLLIGEAGRFPTLARTYYERVPRRVMNALSAGLEALAARGMLRIPHAPTAASHLAFLILGLPLDEAMFCIDEAADPTEFERTAVAGVNVFLAAYAA